MDGDDAPLEAAANDAVAAQLEAVTADPVALCVEIRKHVATEDKRAAVAQFLRSVDALVMQQVAQELLRETMTVSDASTDESSRGSAHVLLLLGSLLIEFKQRFLSMESRDEDLVQTMIAYFKVATKRLSAESLMEKDRAMFLQWCDHVLELVRQEKPGALEMEKDDSGTGSEWIVAIAALLLRLHDTIAQRAVSPTSVSFKVTTLVWKNLTKMASPFADVLANASEGSLSRYFDNEEKHATFHVDDVMSSVIASMEQCVQQLCDEGLSDAMLLTSLKFLRLFWRAFQGQLLCYINVLTSEVESSVMALVNVGSILLKLSRRTNSRVPENVQAEAWRLMSMVAGVAEKLGEDASINASTKEQMRILLWHSDDEMVRAIKQRRELANDSASASAQAQNLEASIRGSHLLIVAAFGSTDDNILPAEDPHEDIGGAKILAASAMLLERYQHYASQVVAQDLREPNELFLDFLMAMLLKVDDLEELQLFLIKQALHPDPSRRFIIWEVWREFMCYSWDEECAGTMLSTLIEFGQYEGTTGKLLAAGTQSEVFELIAFLYPDMADSLKKFCIDHATDVIDAICSEGPDHKFTLFTASQLNFLEKLSSVSFLKSYDHPGKVEWVAKYLPMCFECCGTVLDLLNSTSNPKPEKKTPMLRILDLCLLVVKAIFDDDGSRESDAEDLSRLLVPLASEIVSHLAKCKSSRPSAATNSMASHRSRKNPTMADMRLDDEESHTLHRILESCTYLLGKLGSALKRNQSNQFVLVMKDVCQLLEQTSGQEANGIATSIAWFAKNTLYDVQVAEEDMEVVWQLFTRLFRNLSSKSGGKTTSPQLSTTFDAFYQLLAHSNVANHQSSNTNRSVQEMLHENVRDLFRDFLSLQQISREEAQRVSTITMIKTSQAQVRWQHQQLFSERFPEEKDEIDASNGVKRDHDELDAMIADGIIGEESTGGRLTKRQKVEIVASMCKRIHESLASNDASDALTEEELDDASRMLRQLLARTSS
ncbi:hypothetical protein FI667_g9201, partial [Globisporangium splendens]